MTVVVPARDEERSIDRCLTALRAQDYADLRIVVVDDAFADRTAGIVRRHAEQDPRVTLIGTSGPPPGWAGKVHALHVGTAGLDTDWLPCFDADTEAAPDLVGRLVAAARRDRVDLVSTSGRAARPDPAGGCCRPSTSCCSSPRPWTGGAARRSPSATASW
ncbi:glycosyltransferase [Saccharothrix longispora]|uniref:Cellulose synthase/poly-beta-1,6-N-acetylglucosamine synthase-like glycosyltransferase n=1 Tax=Saccharothrix longispora TaxID=33920 RepID=A0ABU1Q646_9PSEU|nr:glycosyltransferase [Saccharothrix longispora]MDR6598370.1 cellulose synthase/poly-beta-1,6-N-acetylglucosamine synthase-like glycosyltransferase [Saccharothrix longispora]